MNIDLIGCGKWGSNHIREINNIGILANVSDINKDLADSVAKAFKCNSLSVDDLHKSSSDTLFICTTANTHFDLLKKFIPKYKNIFCEKPLVLNYENAIEIKQLSEIHNTKIVVGHLLHYHPAIIEIDNFIKKQNLQDNLFQINCFRESFGVYRKFENVTESFSTHDFAIVLKFFKSKIKKIEKIFDKSKISESIDQSIIKLTFENDCKSIIKASWLSGKKKHLIEFIFDRMIIVFDDLETIEKKVEILHFDKFENEVNPIVKFREFLTIKNDKSPLRNEIESALSFFNEDVKFLPNNIEESVKILELYSKIFTDYK